MKNFFLKLFTVIITILIIVYPENTILYSKKALDSCYEVIIPSLFPFFVCSGLLIYSGFAKTLSKLLKPIMKPLFNINENGSCAFVLGIISGYPLGSVTACQLYESGYLSKSETERLLAFCNNSGPLFILGAIGSSIYFDKKIGVILYFAHILSAITVGILFRFYNKNSYSAPYSNIGTSTKSISEIFSTVLSNSINSILTVCGSIIFFFTVTNIITTLISNDMLDAMLTSLLEMTGGTQKISELNIPLTSKLLLSSFAVGFSGFCVHLQVMSVTSKYSLKLTPYFLGKVLQSLISTLYTLGFIYLLPHAKTVFNNSEIRLSRSFFLGSSFSVCSVTILVFLLIFKKMSKFVDTRSKV